MHILRTTDWGLICESPRTNVPLTLQCKLRPGPTVTHALMCGSTHTLTNLGSSSLNTRCKLGLGHGLPSCCCLPSSTQLRPSGRTRETAE